MLKVEDRSPGSASPKLTAPVPTDAQPSGHGSTICRAGNWGEELEGQPGACRQTPSKPAAVLRPPQVTLSTPFVAALQPHP